EMARGNNMADRAAKEAALRGTPVLAVKLIDLGDRNLPESPCYSLEDLQWIKGVPMTQYLKGWWRSSDNKIILPEEMGIRVLSKIHQASHMGQRRPQDLVRQSHIKIKDANSKIEQIVSKCRACQLTNATRNPHTLGTRLRGRRPGASWETDFTEVKPGRYGYRYLLVFVDTFSGWTEAYPTKYETAQVVAKKLLEDILPRYGFPQMIGSDNGPAFVSKVSQSLATTLGIDWKLHCAYRPQSSG
ncbi:TF26 protein, partial [Crocuta crocuta]